MSALPPQPLKAQSVSKKIRWQRRIVVVLFCVILGAISSIGRPTLHLLQTMQRDVNQLRLLPQGMVDDVSRRNETQVAEVWKIPSDIAAAEQQLAELLRRADQDGLRVSIAGTRHSMGGHTIYPQGIVVDMLPFHQMELDEQTNVLHVGAGARWLEIIPYLEKHGRSVAIMQSDNAFSVGGSISVNCHGWQFGRPPISVSVDSFRIMRADGEIVRCSRICRTSIFLAINC